MMLRRKALRRAGFRPSTARLAKQKATRPASGIRPTQRLKVAYRDQGLCVRCGRSVVNFPASQHHRLMRSRGGSDNLANLLVLCGSGTTYCHGDVHAHPSQGADDGFLCRTGENPADVPVLTIHGWRYFTDDGRVLTGIEWERDRREAVQG